MSRSSHRRERTLKRSFFLVLSLTQALMEREGEVHLESQVTHDILLDTCNRMGGSRGRATLDMGSHSAEYSEGHLLEKVDIICREESKASMATSPPPALIHHLNVSDDVIWIKGNLITSLWREN